MPWEERSLMDVRLRFVQDIHRPGWSVAEVCRRYQVSRKTGYKWLERYEQVGPAGLVDRHALTGVELRTGAGRDAGARARVRLGRPDRPVLG